MYTIIKTVVILICVIGIIYMIRTNKKYHDDTSGREEIIKYFKDKGAISVEVGIRIKELPIEIAKSNYLLLMVKDKTLIFKSGKYYLNVEKVEE